MSTKTPLVSDEHAQETLVAISTYEGEGGRRFFLDGWNGDSQKHWTDAVKWTRSHYESELQSLRSRLERMEAAGNAMRTLLHYESQEQRGKIILEEWDALTNK